MESGPGAWCGDIHAIYSERWSLTRNAVILKPYAGYLHIDCGTAKGWERPLL